MRRPPSPTQIPAYPVTAGIGLLAIAVTLITRFARVSVDRLDVAPIAFRAQPWRLFTSTLPHVDPFHLAFNVYWLWVFGTLLEEALGHARLLGLILLYAAGSMAAEYALMQGGVGLSGVGYGLFAMVWVLSTRDKRFTDGVDKRTAQLFGFWFVLCVALTARGMWRVANVAHGVGAIMGALVGLAMAARGAGRRALAAAGVVVLLVASLLGAGLFRARINLTHDGSRSLFLGNQAVQEGKFDEAIHHYRETVAVSPDSAVAWHNMGYAYDASGRSEEAIAPLRRAYEVDPHDSRHKAAFLGASRRAAAQARKRGDHQRAAALLRQALEKVQEDADTWLDLAFELDALGDAGEATKARAKAREFAAPAR